MAKVLLVIPTEGVIDYRTSMYAAYLSHRPDVAYLGSEGRPADYARNNLVRLFLRMPSEFMHLFILDSDVVPPPDGLDKLLALLVPIATGCYPVLMQSGLRWALANKDDNQLYRLLDRLPSGIDPFEVDAGGAGCLLIRRDVFEKIKWPWFKWLEKKDGSQISEDIAFFRKANKASLRVTVEPTVICDHYKKTNLTRLMKIFMSLKEKSNVD